MPITSTSEIRRSIVGQSVIHRGPAGKDGAPGVAGAAGDPAIVNLDTGTGYTTAENGRIYVTTASGGATLFVPVGVRCFFVNGRSGTASVYLRMSPPNVAGIAPGMWSIYNENAAGAIVKMAHAPQDYGTLVNVPTTFAAEAHAASHAPGGDDSLLDDYAPAAIEITSGEKSLYPYEYTISGTTPAVPNLRYAGLYNDQPTWTNDGAPYTSATWGMIRSSGPSGGFTISDFGSNYWFAESQADYPPTDLTWTIPSGSTAAGDPGLSYDSWYPVASAVGQVLKLPPAVMYNPPRIYTAVRAGADNSEWKEISALVSFQVGTPISWGSTPGQTIQEMTRVISTDDTSVILGPEDAGTVIRTNSATTINIQMPETDPGEGWSCMVIQGGDGQVTFVAGTGNTIQSFLGLVSTAGNYAVATILRVDLNTYLLGGNLS